MSLSVLSPKRVFLPFQAFSRSLFLFSVLSKPTLAERFKIALEKILRKARNSCRKGSITYLKMLYATRRHCPAFFGLEPWGPTGSLSSISLLSLKPAKDY